MAGAVCSSPSRRRNGEEAEFKLAACAAVWICVVILGPSVLTLLVQAQTPPIEVFLNAKELQVRLIAGNASINYEETCTNLANCELPESCSRGACEFATGQVETLECATIVNNTNCIIDENDICNVGLVSYEESFVRIPIKNLSGVPSEVRNALCTQKVLDGVFRSFGKEDRGGTEFFNYVLGTVEGTHRFYPGRTVPNCQTYDARQRPWYNGAISIKKSLVILLDSSQSMGSIQGAITTGSSLLQIGVSTTVQVLHTLTPTDVVSVVTFGPTASAVELGGQFKVPETGLDTESQELLSLVEAVRNLSLSSNPGPANITAGFSEALSQLRAAPPDAMKVVVVLTAGKFGGSVNITELEPVLQELVAQKVFVLMYGIGVPSDPKDLANLNITQIACAVNGSYEPMANLQNPLYGVKSLYSFFARTHLAKFNQSFWQPRFLDFDGLGPVIQVTYPVMSKDGIHMVGVAGIEVQVQSLNPLLQGDIANALLQRQAGEIVKNPNGEGAALSCAFLEENYFNCTTAGSFSGMCLQTDFSSGLTERACCNSCGGIATNSSTNSSTNPSTNSSTNPPTNSSTKSSSKRDTAKYAGVFGGVGAVLIIGIALGAVVCRFTGICNGICDGGPILPPPPILLPTPVQSETNGLTNSAQPSPTK